MGRTPRRPRGLARAAHRGRRQRDAGNRPLLLRVRLLPRAERHPLRAGDDRRSRIHRRRAARATGAAPLAAARVRAPPRPGRARPAAPAGHQRVASGRDASGLTTGPGSPPDGVSVSGVTTVDVVETLPGEDPGAARARVRTAFFSVLAACFLVAIKL